MKKQQSSLLAFISFVEAFFFGIGFIYLFTWKLPGIAHLVFFTLVIFGSFIPLLVLQPQKLLKKNMLFLTAFPFMAALMSIFMYRLNPAWMFLAYVSLPLVCTFYLAGIHVEGTFANFGVFSYLILPFKIFIAWFIDAFKFIHSLSFKEVLGKESKVSSWIKRVALGLVFALPFAVFFLVMFSMADSIFAEKIGNILDDTFIEWFEDWESFMSFLGRLAVGIIVAIYWAVFNFSLWNEESKLKEGGKKI